MNANLKRTLFHALLASFALTVIPGYAAETRDTKAAVSDTTILAETCASGDSIPKSKVTKAVNRMLDMGETPAAAKMDKDARRKMQFDVFWKEVAKESEGG